MNKIKFVNKQIAYPLFTKISEVYKRETTYDYQKSYMEFDNTIVVNVPGYDRTRTKLSPYILTENYDPIPNIIQNYNKSFEDICFKRAKDLLEVGKPIYILWSGGLDSTTIISSFLYHDFPKDQVTIKGNHNSIYESGWLYDKFLKGRINIDISSFNDIINLKDVHQESLIIYGNRGNHVTGGVVSLLKYDYEDLSKPFIDFISENEAIFSEDTIKKYPVRIKTLEEYYQWKSFNFHWTMTSYIYSMNQPKYIRDMFIDFYQTNDFQDWFVSTKEPKIIEKNNTIIMKPQMRQIIEKVIGDTYYCENKKVFSSIGMLPNMQIIFIFENDDTLELQNGEIVYVKSNN